MFEEERRATSRGAFGEIRNRIMDIIGGRDRAFKKEARGLYVQLSGATELEKVIGKANLPEGQRERISDEYHNPQGDNKELRQFLLASEQIQRMNQADIERVLLTTIVIPAVIKSLVIEAGVEDKKAGFESMVKTEDLDLLGREFLPRAAFYHPEIDVARIEERIRRNVYSAPLDLGH